MKLLIPVTNKHAPIKRMTVKTVTSPWIDEELKNCMIERDEAKVWQISLAAQLIAKRTAKLRNRVTKLKKNKLHYETKIDYIKNDSKKLWDTLNKICGKKPT
jgi:F420-dependent methylenetetrahydromethanopterin dehydrogenase